MAGAADTVLDAAGLKLLSLAMHGRCVVGAPVLCPLCAVPASCELCQSQALSNSHWQLVDVELGGKMKINTANGPMLVTGASVLGLIAIRPNNAC